MGGRRRGRRWGALRSRRGWAVTEGRDGGGEFDVGWVH